MNILHSTLNTWRERLAPITHTSTFLETGQITPEEFVLAGDYLVYKFPSWKWSEASSPDRRVSYLPEKKQFLMTRGVPCNRRLDDNFAGEAGREGVVVTDGFGAGGEGAGRRNSGDDDDGWMNTGPMTESHQGRINQVQTMDESGSIGETEDDDEDVPDMEEEDDDEAIIRDPSAAKSMSGSARNYSLYVTYSSYYRTPRIYLSGYINNSEPLAPHLMMEDIVGDYKDKTVTLEDFPFFDSGVKMASVHPCKHAPVMRVLLDRADAALKLRMEKIRRAAARGDGKVPDNLNSGLEGLIDDTSRLTVSGGDKTGHSAGVGAAGGNAGDEWEVLQHEPGEDDDDRYALRVDQYLIVFLKFIASVTPGIEHDFTMGV